MPWNVEKTTLLANAVFLTAIYIDQRYQVLLKYSQKTVAQAHVEGLWRRMHMLLESVGTTQVKCPDSSSESENGSTPACGFDIVDEILATSDTCNASSTQSPRDEQNVT